jgi:hypothetical protein
MEPAPARPRHEAIGHDDQLVRKWRLALPATVGAAGLSLPGARAGLPYHASLARQGWTSHER